MNELKIHKININEIRFLAKEGFNIDEIADILNISYQVLKQYYNKGRSNKRCRNYAFYRSIYKAILYGKKEYKSKFK